MIIFYTASDKKLTFTDSDLNISTMGSDFIISLKGKPRALRWSEDEYISISDLYKLIKNRWTYIQEEDTDDVCSQCQGGSCNNSCFFYRNKRVDSIRLFADLEKEILKFSQRADQIIRESNEQVFYNLEIEFESDYNELKNDIGFLINYFEISNISQLQEKVKIINLKKDFLRNDNFVTIVIENNDNHSVQRIKLHPDGVTLDWNLNFFFVRKYSIQIDSFTSCNHWEGNNPGRLLTTLEIDSKKSNKEIIKKLFSKKVDYIQIRLKGIEGSKKYALIAYK